MATRSGGASTALIGKLSEARQSLEKQLGLPVAARMGASLSLMVAVKSDEEREKVTQFLGKNQSFQRFAVEIRELAKAQDKNAKKK